MHARSLLFLAAFYILTPIWAILLLTTMVSSSHKPVARGILIWSDVTLWLLRRVAGIEVEFRGRGKLPSSGAYLLASKHQSSLDAFAIFKCEPNLVCIVKQELFMVPVIGSVLRKLGVVAIKRGTGKAHEKIPGAEDLFAGAGRPLLLFPEGTRVAVGDVKPLKSGVYHYHVETGLPVYTMASNVGLFWPAHGLAMGRGTVVYEIHDAMPAGLGREDFMALIHERIVGGSEALVRATVEDGNQGER